MPDLVRSQGVDPEKEKSIDLREYIYNMAAVMSAADVIISRAGASTCNEIGACGIPCILIPSPNVTNNHQEKNARMLADRGAAILIPEKECTSERLFNEINALLDDDSRREQMRRKLREMVRLDATERICDIVEELCKR